MQTNNPFRPTKFEWEKQPVIWLSRRAKNLIGSIKPVYISGSRGSGKTTILRSLSTRQISSDSSLRQQFGQRRLSWYGQYLQFNHTFQEQTGSVLRSAGIDDTSEAQSRLFSTYFELTLLLAFLNDLLHFQDKDFLHFKSKVEAEACVEIQHILASFPWAAGRRVRSFQDARRLIRDIQLEFLKPSWTLDAAGVAQAIGALVPGNIVRFIKDYALASIQSQSFATDSLDFFILLDDCESLSEAQQVALNTYIRRTEGVAKWVVCFLSGRFNSTDTNISNTVLTNDDRELFFVNEMTEGEFSDLSERVATMRLEAFLDQVPSYRRTHKENSFSLESCFGKAEPYNELISQVIRSSENTGLEAFKADVSATRDRLAHFIDHQLHSRFSCETGSHPYIEHIVLDALNVDVKSYPTREEQSSLAKTVAGKQAAAYIAFCAKFNLKPIYCGANYVRSVSDKSIRDFLDVMAEFFDQVAGLGHRASVSPVSLAKSANEFLSGRRINTQLQSKAILQASYVKFQNLAQLRVSEPEIERLVLCVVALQSHIEKDHEAWRSVRIPTRGKYLIEFPISDGQLAERSHWARLYDAIWRLEFDRYIKVINKEVRGNFEEISFSLHRRLRPYISCGYTGPYDPPIILPINWLMESINGNEAFDAEKWAGEKYGALVRTSKFDNQLKLSI